MDEPILGYGVIYGPDHKMRSSFSRAELWAAIEELEREAASDGWDARSPDFSHNGEVYSPDRARARQHVLALLGMDAPA